MKRHLFLGLFGVLCVVGCNRTEPKANKPTPAAPEQVAEKKRPEAVVEKITAKKETSEKDRKSGPETSGKDNTTVIAEGFGGTAADSLKDAFRNAVRQVVGAVVDAETLVKNEQIISDKVLTYSDGLVKSYEEISTKQDEGIFRTKIKATVERRSVMTKLKAANISAKIDGKNLAATIETRIEARRDGAKLLQKHLDDLSLVLTAEGAKFTPEDYDEDKGVLTLKVNVHVDLKAYDVSLKKMLPVLKEISLQSFHDLTLPINPKQGRTSRGEEFLKVLSADSLVSPKTWCIWVMTRLDASNNTGIWNGYVMDLNPSQVFEKKASSPKVRIALLDNGQTELARDEFELKCGPLNHYRNPNCLLGFAIASHRPRPKQFGLNLQSILEPIPMYSYSPWKTFGGKNTTHLVLAPAVFTFHLGSWNAPHVIGIHQSENYSRTIKLSPKDLSRTGSIKYEIVR